MDGQKPKKPELSSLFVPHCRDMISLYVRFHEYIPYGLGLMTNFRNTPEFYANENNSKTKVARIVFLIRSTFSRYDLAIYEVS